jgi:pimeloyl-ACP methyl ester carboxylesterase
MLLTSFFSAPAFTRKLRAFPGEVLVLWGEKDLIMPASSAQALRRSRPGLSFRLIGGAGHLPHQEAALTTAEAIEKFLANH